MITMLYVYYIITYIIINICFNSSPKPFETFFSPWTLGADFTFTAGSSTNNITTARYNS